MSPSIAWSASSVVMMGLAAYLTNALMRGNRAIFLPGPTSAGHYQIEERCELCHSESFADRDAIQGACVECHGAELEAVDDSHPRSKFTDPRNAARTEILDARYCATCHREHAPRQTGEMGLTLPADYCFYCHQDIGEDRPSHASLPYAGCAASGCHNFHDNRSLYEDFLVRHASGPALLGRAILPQRRTILSHATPIDLEGADAPLTPEWRPSPEALARFAGASHPRAGVNCSDCHRPDGSAWSKAVSPSVCGRCHDAERAGFGAGRHGMRIASDLPPMRPDLARLPMQEDASGRELGCTSCHGAHEFNTARAATDACLECHADRHSLAFRESKHAQLASGPVTEGVFATVTAEPEAVAPDASAVTCATCHLPRVREGRERGRVEHNQNANLRPSDKMLRSVCMQCHGLVFSIDALADRALVDRNFTGSPSRHVPSVDWAVSRVGPESRSTREKPE